MTFIPVIPEVPNVDERVAAQEVASAKHYYNSHNSHRGPQIKADPHAMVLPHPGIPSEIFVPAYMMMANNKIIPSLIDADHRIATDSTDSGESSYDEEDERDSFGEIRPPRMCPKQCERIFRHTAAKAEQRQSQKKVGGPVINNSTTPKLQVNTRMTPKEEERLAQDSRIDRSLQNGTRAPRPSLCKRLATTIFGVRRKRRCIEAWANKTPRSTTTADELEERRRHLESIKSPPPVPLPPRGQGLVAFENNKPLKFKRVGTGKQSLKFQALPSFASTISGQKAKAE